MAEVRTLVTFQSLAFKASERKDYFVTDSCYGEDVARWLITQLRALNIQTDTVPSRKISDGTLASALGTRITGLSLGIVQPTGVTPQFGLAGLSAKQG